MGVTGRWGVSKRTEKKEVDMAKQTIEEARGEGDESPRGRKYPRVHSLPFS